MASSIPPRVQRLAGVALRQARMLDPTPSQVALYQKRLSQLTPDEIRYLQTLQSGRTTDVSSPDAVLFALEKANPIYKTDDYGESILGVDIRNSRKDAREYAAEQGLARPTINAPLSEQIASYQKIYKDPYEEGEPFVVWAEKGGLQRSTPLVPNTFASSVAQASAQINNAIRQPQGLNTGATQDLNSSNEILLQNLPQPSHIVLRDGRALTPEEIQANYNKSFAVRPKADLSAVDRYLGIEGRDYSGQDSATAFNDFMRVAAGASRPVQEVVNELPKRIDGVGYPEVKTYWGTVNGRTAPHPSSVLSKQKESYDSPTYPHPVQLWAETTDPIRLLEFPSTITTKSGNIIAAPARIVLERNPTTFPDGYQLTLGQQPRKEYLTLEQSLAHLEAIQNAGMAHATGRAVSNNPDAGPTTETWDVKLGGLDLAQGAGWVVRPQNQNKALGEVFNSQPIQMVTSDIERGVRGVSDYRLMPAANRRVSSDALPMAAQWKTELQRNIVPLPVPTREQAIKTAQLDDNAAWLDYKAQQEGLLKERPGSFNIVVDNNGTYQRAIDEGLMPGMPNPDNPEQDFIPNLYLGNEPYRVKINADGRVALPDLDRINVHIPGMGRFPMTGGATLDVELARKYPDKPENQSQFTLKNLVRDRNNQFMMDALDALKFKQKQYERATAQYLSAKESPTVTQTEAEALEKIALGHWQQYEQGMNAYNAAMRLEPQPSMQQVKVNLNVANPEEYGDRLADYGLTLNGNSAEGAIPINKLHKLNSFLASKFNREELALPPDVSIASEIDAFKKAGIAPNTLLKGVEWGNDDKGRQTIINTGTPIGMTWEGQRVLVDPQAQQAEVRQIPTYRRQVYERDPEMDELIEAREAAKQQRVNKLIEVVNARKAARGEPLLAVNDAGEVYQLDNSSIQVLQNPEAIGNAVFSSTAQKKNVFNQETADSFNQLLAVEEAKHPAIAQAIANNPETYNQAVGSFGALQSYASPGLDSPRRYKQEPTMKANKISKQRLGYSNSKSAPDFVNSSLANTNGLEEDAFTRKLRLEAEAAMAAQEAATTAARSNTAEAIDTEAIARHQQMMLSRNAAPVVAPATVNLNQRPATLDWVQQLPDQPLLQVDVIEMYRDQLGTVPVSNNHSRQAWSQPVGDADAAAARQERGWNHYYTAAAALGALGLGAGVGYMVAPRGRSEEEEALRQQLMQQQMMLAQMQGRAR